MQPFLFSPHCSIPERIDNFAREPHADAQRAHNIDMIRQFSFRLKPRPRGCYLVTDEVLSHLPRPLPEAGLVNLFLRHTSCALTINENADPDVRTDMTAIMERLVPDGEPYYRHTLEGADDMPAHAVSSLLGASLTIPITDGRLNLGLWQGIWLTEWRNARLPRTIVATIIS